MSHVANIGPRTSIPPRVIDMDSFIVGWATGLVAWTTAMLFLVVVV